MISAAQIQEFRDNGFLHIPGAISPEELALLRRAADALIENRDTLPPEQQHDFKYGALVGDGIGEGDVLCRLEYTLDKSPHFLALAANPLVLQFATAIHGEQVVLTWEDMIIKTPFAGFGVPFHQDLLYQSTRSIVFSMGIYLDDSGADPLTCIPGTQRLGPLSEEEIAGLAAERRAEHVEVPVRAGDCLVHNVLVIHGSPENRSDATRRVIYLEFRTADQVRDDSPWDEEWLQQRLQLLPAAVAARRSMPEYEAIDRRYAERGFTYDAALVAPGGAPPAGVCLRVPHDDE